MNLKDCLKWLGRTLLTATAWVFILSIQVRGQTLFAHSHEILIENPFVEAIDEGLGDLWYRVSETARVTFNNLTSRDGNEQL